MNRVKFVPADPATRALAKPEVLTVQVTQRKKSFFHKPLFKLFRRVRRPTLREAEELAKRRGWIRLDTLAPVERRKYRGATAVRS